MIPSTDCNFQELFTDLIYREWVLGSAIHPDLLAANVEIIPDEFVLAGGEVARPISDTLNWNTSRWQLCGGNRSYAALIKTVDISTGELISFQVKLENPIFDIKKGKVRKYENPAKRGQVGGFACVSKEIWQKVAARHGLTLPTDISDRYWHGKEFWDWVIANNLPIVITEGMKKACSLLSLGYGAIALSGITMGRQTLADGSVKLQEYLEIFTTSGRDIYFCFDAETKSKTLFDVHLAQSRTGKLFADAGCNVKIIELPLLPNTDKTGADDFIVAKGAIAFDECLNNARDLFGYQWYFKHARKLKTKPSVTVSTHSLLNAIDSLPLVGIIAIASGKATEKTKIIAREVANDTKVIALTHLISLGKNLSNRIGLSWRNDLDHAKGFGYLGSTNRIALCVHSLLMINPQDYIGCTLILDEVCQVLRCILTNSLCNQQGKRGALLARLEALIKVAGRIVIADADLSDAEISYIQQLRDDNQPVYLIRNDSKLDGYKVRVIGSSDDQAIITELIQDLRDGHKIHVCCDSKDKCEAIAKIIESLGLNLRTMVIHSNTSGGEVESEFIADINTEVLHYDVLISSPTLNTGVSIEVEHFTKVYGIYEGVLPDSDICQSLIRYRYPVDRVVWCKKRGLNFNRVSNKTFPTAIHNTLKVSHEAEISIIRSSLNPDLIPFVNTGYSFDNNPHIDLFCHYAAEQNDAMYNLAASLIERLKHEGHTVDIVNPSSPNSEFIETAKAEIKQEQINKLCQSKIVKDRELQQLDQKQHRTSEESVVLQASKLADFYAVDSIDETLVSFDDKGRTREKIRELEALKNPEVAISADTSVIEKQAAFKGFGTSWDIPKRELRRQVRDKSGFSALINCLENGDQLTEPDLAPWYEFVKSNVKALELLGFAARQNKSACWLFRRWCEQMGIQLLAKRDRSTDLDTTYELDLVHWQFLEGILVRRAARRLEKSIATDTETQERSQLCVSECVIAKTTSNAELQCDRNSLIYIKKTPSCDRIEVEPITELDQGDRKSINIHMGYPIADFGEQCRQAIASLAHFWTWGNYGYGF